MGAVDMDQLIQIMVRFSVLVLDLPEIKDLLGDHLGWPKGTFKVSQKRKVCSFYRVFSGFLLSIWGILIGFSVVLLGLLNDFSRVLKRTGNFLEIRRSALWKQFFRCFCKRFFGCSLQKFWPMGICSTTWVGLSDDLLIFLIFLTLPLWRFWGSVLSFVFLVS